MADKTSTDPVEVLFALHEKFDLTDFSNTIRVLTTALHDKNDDNTKAFECTTASAEPQVISEQGVVIKPQITFKEAYDNLKTYDVLVVVGGHTNAVLKENTEPLHIISAFAELQKADSSRERTLMSVCTGSLFLAEQGILSGLSATTHPDYMTKFEIICSTAAQRGSTERTDVIDNVSYVVNNLRFDLGDEDENPYIRRKSDNNDRRPSNARKGSISFSSSNARRESIARRAAMRLGGLRVITGGGVNVGLDAALYLVSILVDDNSANEVARAMQHEWIKGVVVDGLDV